MVKTITIGSCVSVQGLLVRSLEDGRVVIQVGPTQYAGQPVQY
ncbi:hypothetical protein [Oceaniglobus trochenteri]|nr:hypothetical protein [Oceaniglobus trochenteri]